MDCEESKLAFSLPLIPLTPFSVTAGHCFSSNNVFTPKIYTSKRRPSPSGASKDLSSSSSGNEGSYQALVGRAVIYRQDGFLLMIFMDDWPDNQEGPPFLSHHLKALNHDQFMGICGHIQRGITGELITLDKLLQSAAMVADGSVVDSYGMEMNSYRHSSGMNSPGLLSMETLTSAIALISQGRNKGPAMLSERVKLIYDNMCNHACKVSSPLFLCVCCPHWLSASWPTSSSTLL